MDEAHRNDRVADAARERIAEALKAALEPADDAPIDDATRRLMLHLSIETPQAKMSAVKPPASASSGTGQAAASASLLRRIFRQRERKSDGDGSKTGPGAT